MAVNTTLVADTDPDTGVADLAPCSTRREATLGTASLLGTLPPMTGPMTGPSATRGNDEAAQSLGERLGIPTIALSWGHSKDHRPDLKQLLDILTVTDDGGIPIYFTTADGNTTDAR